MPMSTVWILNYVQQCYVKWFWTISSLGAPGLSYREVRETEGSREFEILCGLTKSCPNVLRFFGFMPIQA